jgi:hypothetical protein
MTRQRLAVAASVGGWVGGLATGATALLPRTRAAADPLVVALAVGAVAAVVASAAAAVRLDVDSLPALRSRRTALLAFAVPIVPGGVALARLAGGTDQTVLAATALFAVLAGLVAGFSGLVASQAWFVDHVRATATDAVTVEAADPDLNEHRRPAAIALAVVGVGGFVGGLVLWPGDPITSVPMLSTLAVALSLYAADRREYTFVDSGVVQGVVRYRWERFECYELTDDALTLRAAAWYHGDVALAREDVDDEEGVVDVVADALPRCD